MDSFHSLLKAYRQQLDGDFIVAIEAQRFYTMMQFEHPDLLAEFLEANAVHFVAQEFGSLLRSERAQMVRRAGARAFSEAVRAGEDLSAFRLTYRVNRENVRRTVGDMTGADHAFVAAEYEASGNKQKMYAAFHRAVARRVGEQRTADVMTEDEYTALLGSIAGLPLAPPIDETGV